MHPQTLRQYDRLGLVTPGRTGGGGRRYSARDVALLREVQRLSQEEGVNLAGIKRIIELETPREALRARIAELQAELARTPRGAGGGPARTRSPRCAATSCRCARARSWSGSRASSSPRSELSGTDSIWLVRPSNRPVHDPGGTRADSRRPTHHQEPGGRRGRPAARGQRRAPEVEPVHLLLALLDQPDGIAGSLLAAVGADPAAVRDPAPRSCCAALPAAQRLDRRRPAGQPGAARRARRRADQGQGGRRRLRLDRAPAGRAGRRRRRRRDAAARPAGAAQGAARRVRRGPRRRPPGDHPGPGGHLPGAGEVRRRPHRAGPRRRARPGRSAATPRSAASCRCSPGGPRTTRC